MKVLLAHPGTQYSHQLAKQLYKNKVLFKFRTGIAFAKDSFEAKLIRLLPSSLQKKISNRIIADVPKFKIGINPLLEYNAVRAIKKGIKSDEVMFKRNLQFQKLIPYKEIQKSNIVIGFDTSSSILMQTAHRSGKKFILDMSTIHSASKEKIQHDISLKYPEWAFNIATKSKEHFEIEKIEMLQADAIVVASTFTKNTLISNGVEESKIYINPYGVNLEDFALKEFDNTSTRKIKFLYLGAVNAAKGIPVILDIWNNPELKNAELSLVGPVTEAMRNLILNKNNSIKVKGKIPFNEVKNLVKEFDVLLFPSYFDGFGQVALEAMATGLPVIASTNTCGPDIIENEKDGFVIDVGNEKQLLEAVLFFVRNPHCIKDMGTNARKKASNFSWDSYGDRWMNILNTVSDKS
ncbi:MAG: glycosyltransferase family 4 protein [Chitinophagaceae bacterium]|nr:glycosyltransferase family 4 protein [Chitinophagaceae bacterium]